MVAGREEFDIKLSDFGLSRTIGEGSFMKTMCGTPQYLAPEILTGGGLDGYGKEVDMWSAGAILYALLCGFPPFDDNKSISIFEQIKQGLVEFPDGLWTNVSPSAKNLIRRLLTVDPSRRYSAVQTKNHPWMKGEITVPPELEFTPTSTPLPPTPTKPTPVIPTKPPSDDEQYGSVINYNKTLEEREKEKTAATPPSTPTTNSTHSTPSTVTNSPSSAHSSSFITPASSPTPPDKGSSSNSISLKDSGSIKAIQVQAPKLKNSQKLVSLESEKNLQKQFEKVGLEKRKRSETEDDEDTDEDESLKPPSKPNSFKSPPSPPATKKLKKSATAEIKPMSDSEEDEPPIKKAPTKASSSDQLLGAKKDSKQNLKHQNSFNSKKSNDSEEEEDADSSGSSSSGNGKGNNNGKSAKKKDNRPMCKYGASCYRKNPLHLQEFQHP